MTVPTRASWSGTARWGPSKQCRPRGRSGGAPASTVPASGTVLSPGNAHGHVISLDGGPRAGTNRADASRRPTGRSFGVHSRGRLTGSGRGRFPAGPLFCLPAPPDPWPWLTRVPSQYTADKPAVSRERMHEGVPETASASPPLPGAPLLSGRLRASPQAPARSHCPDLPGAALRPCPHHPDPRGLGHRSRPAGRRSRPGQRLVGNRISRRRTILPKMR